MSLSKAMIALTMTMLAAQSLVHAQNAARPAEPSLSSGFVFEEKTGDDLFANICGGCHMPDGGGATGAGTYPSLARDGNLESGGYPLYIVVNGQRAMPGFGKMLNDDQVAAVVNYIRTHFGNDYRDTVSAADVKAARQ